MDTMLLGIQSMYKGAGVRSATALGVRRSHMRKKNMSRPDVNRPTPQRGVDMREGRGLVDRSGTFEAVEASKRRRGCLFAAC